MYLSLVSKSSYCFSFQSPSLDVTLSGRCLLAQDVHFWPGCTHLSRTVFCNYYQLWTGCLMPCAELSATPSLHYQPGSSLPLFFGSHASVFLCGTYPPAGGSSSRTVHSHCWWFDAGNSAGLLANGLSQKGFSMKLLGLPHSMVVGYPEKIA